MFVVLSALALAGTPASALYHQAADEAEKDPIVCKGNRSSRSIGSNMIKGKTCKPKSEWEQQERANRRELQSLTDRWKSGGDAKAR